MKNFFKLIFGAPSAATSVIDGVKKGADALVFTEQEKQELNLKSVEYLTEYMKATTGQDLARRLIAIMIMVQWSFFSSYGGMSFILGYQEYAKGVLQFVSEVYNPPFMMVMAFYFLKRIVPVK